MYSRDDTVNAILRFYQQVIRHPYLNDSTLVLPPPGGWRSVNIQGKNNTVLDLLHHLPYLRPGKPYERLLIYWETVPICYTDEYVYPELYPLPAQCVYLACSVDREGTSLILDTDKGTITEFCHTGTYITMPEEEYEALPEEEKWKAHRTSPIRRFLDVWTQRYEKLVWMLIPNPIGQPTTGRFYSRADTSAELDVLTLEEQSKPWHLKDDVDHPDFEYELDRAQYEWYKSIRKHVADVYDTYLRHGWPDHFDKDRCRSELLQLEELHDAEEKQKLDKMNPDAADLSD
ncbi:hypothetical protein F4813DRAFT_256030 [Daldinia decipiens]|uniref:uncharacterized protein n=1 Tax=Daldinia decipiens TaxID=326647 RepID=UPI0020C5447C|nr:uncharacterized protein F4813DRAFT_256030 [Daldinia decipiens]KAI1653407.1 hypothetical protein F4813DRAFT_256030 [Daldinia decipiens]